MLKRTRCTVVLLAAAMLLPVRKSLGWIDTGHKVVALIAWQDLTPATKAAVTAALKQHPRYEKDLLAGNETDATPDETDRHVFAVAATWPDIVRNQANPMHTEFHHPGWHYIDIPFDPDNTPVTEKTNDAKGPHNAVEALEQCSKGLTDPNEKPEMKAVDLCWIEHITGDIHQPLHAASLFSKTFPDGDAGGNSEQVLRDPPYPDSKANLHFLWDSLPGDFKYEQMDIYEANGLRADPKYSRDKMKDLLAVTDFMAWAKESHELAVKDVYLDGKLETANVPKGRRSAAGQDVPGVPPDYMKNAEKVAMHQVALAGYRLADLLNRTYDPAMSNK